MDFGKMEVIYFCAEGLNSVIELKWLGKLDFWCTGFCSERMQLGDDHPLPAFNNLAENSSFSAPQNGNG